MYDDFLKFANNQGLDFPCTVNQFAARVAAFLGDKWNADDFDAIMTQGCGHNWKD